MDEVHAEETPSNILSDQKVEMYTQTEMESLMLWTKWRWSTQAHAGNLT